MSLLPVNVYYWEEGVCEVPLGGLFNLWILTCVPPARGHPWALSAGYICKTLDAKNSPDAVAQKEGNVGVWGVRQEKESRGSVNLYLLNNFYFPGK